MNNTLSREISTLAPARKARPAAGKAVRRSQAKDTQPTIAAIDPKQEQLLKEKRVQDKAVSASRRAGLGQTDQDTLAMLLQSQCDYVHNQMFEPRNAEKLIFDDAPAIRQPDTAWYHPVMDNLTSRTIKLQNTTPLVLTAEEERALFLQFNYCRYRANAIRHQIGDKTPTVRQVTDILHWHQRAEAYRDQIAQTNLALVLAMAKRTRMSEVDFSDLVSEGNMALLRAVDKFDAARGFKFSTYACRAILKAFSRAGVKLSKYRAMFPTEFDAKYEKSDHMDRKRQTHEEECVDELRDIFSHNTAELTDIEKEVIEHRFAITPKGKADTQAEPLTLEQVGRIIGVTKERVRQIQNKALEKLRVSLEGGFLS